SGSAALQITTSECLTRQPCHSATERRGHRLLDASHWGTGPRAWRHGRPRSTKPHHLVFSERQPSDARRRPPPRVRRDALRTARRTRRDREKTLDRITGFTRFTRYPEHLEN